MREAPPPELIGLGDRQRQVERLSSQQFDVLVIGGGINGAGVALDLIVRGLSVALIEQADFASGTSSRSSKLIHGGLRYLAQMQFAVTRESLRERQILGETAPALVTSLPFIIPVSGGILHVARIAFGLTLYDALSGGTNGPPFSYVRRTDLAKLAPGMRTEEIDAAFVYRDSQTDDARLTLAVLVQAAKRGAVVANYVGARHLLREGPAIVGAQIQDCLTMRTFDVRARLIVFATGAWGDHLPGEQVATRIQHLRPTKGVHLVFRRDRIDPRVALYIETGIDNRLIFIVPWMDRVLVGTTDTDYTGPLNNPSVGASDVRYLLRIMNRAFPNATLTVDDVVGAQAGVRPLIASAGTTHQASRGERISRRSDGAIVIGGGKLTTYRRIAERVGQLATTIVGGQPGNVTESIAIAPLYDSSAVRNRLVRHGIGSASADRLFRIYGDNALTIAGIIDKQPHLLAPIVSGHPPILAEVAYGASFEQACKIGDVLARRTRLILIDHQTSVAAASKVANVLARALHWDKAQTQLALEAFTSETKHYGLESWHA